MHKRVLAVVHKDTLSSLGSILNRMIDDGTVDWDWYAFGGRYSHLIPISSNAKKVGQIEDPFYEGGVPYEDVECNHAILNKVNWVNVCKLSQFRFDVVEHLTGEHGTGGINTFVDFVTDIYSFNEDAEIERDYVHVNRDLADAECRMLWDFIKRIGAVKRVAKDWRVAIIDAHY